jgi:hypothetical protein
MSTDPVFALATLILVPIGNGSVVLSGTVTTTALALLIKTMVSSSPAVNV